MISLLALKIVLLLAPTFESYVDATHLVWLRYPIRKNTVPGWALQVRTFYLAVWIALGC